MNTFRRALGISSLCALSFAQSSTRLAAQTLAAPITSSSTAVAPIAAPPTAAPTPTATPTSVEKFVPNATSVAVKSGAISFDDAFAQGKARNPDGLIFTVSLGDKTQFHMGELIPIELRFSSTRPKAYKTEMRNYDRSGRLNGMDDFVVSPSEGVVDPLGSVDFWGMFGGISAMPPILSLKPAVVPLTLTEYLRFDKPGKYRLFVTSNRVFSASQTDASMFGSPTAVSDIVEFEILPFDAAWSSQKLKDIVARLGSTNGALRQQAGEELCYLDTPEAIREIVARFGEGADENWYSFHYGLIGSRHRELVIEEMQRQIDSPSGAVSSAFLRDLTTLMFEQTHPAPLPLYVQGDKAKVLEYSNARNRSDATLKQISDANWKRLQRAIAQKSGQARALSLNALLETPAPDAQSSTTLARQVLATFLDLPPEKQQQILQSNWSAIRQPAALPVLRTLLARTTPAFRDDYTNRQWFGLLLTRLMQLSPEEGRRAIIKEIEYSNPRAKIAVLGTLPDATLPTLDDVLIQRLEQSRDFTDGEIHAQLIERYASPRIAPRVKAFFEKLPNGNWPYAAGYALLAYLLRADPPYGLAAIKKMYAHPENGNAYEVLTGVASLHTDAAFEQFIVAQLQNPDANVVRDAATALGQSGSASTEDVLWTRLRQFQRGVAAQSVAAQSVAAQSVAAQSVAAQSVAAQSVAAQSVAGGRMTEAQKSVEESLWKALAAMPGPTLRRDKMQKLYDLVTDKWARQQIEEILKYNSWAAPTIGYSALGFDAMYHLGQNPRPLFASFEALTRKLSQFPRGTTFAFEDDPVSSPQDNANVRDHLEEWLQTRGMNLTSKPS